MSMTEEEVSRIAKAEKRAILPAVYLSIALALGGWVWNLAIAQAKQEEHDKRIGVVELRVEPVSVMQNEITHIREMVNDLKIQQKEDKKDILDAIRLIYTKGDAQ